MEFKWEDDEFDDTFFQEVDKLEELAITQHHHPQPPSTTATTTTTTVATTCCHPPPPISGAIDVSYSPPRELSQRFPPDTTNSNSNIQQHLEIDRLKSELSRVSKQLSDLKDECFEFRRERDKKKPKRVHSNAEADTLNPGALGLDPPRSGNAHSCANTSAAHATSCLEQKSIGIQTERGDESVSSSTNSTTSDYNHPKLLAIWSIGSSHRSRRNLIAKLLETCATDFCYLFGLNPNMASKIEGGLSNFVAVAGNGQGLHSAEAARLSRLYSVLMKLSNDMVPVDALVEVLLDLCRLENVLVVRRSLHILHVALDHLSSMDRTPPRRDNIKVERHESDAVDIHDLEVGKSGFMHDISGNETSSSRCVTAFKNIGTAEQEYLSMVSHVKWFDLFESLRQIAEGLTEENARAKAVSIMNLILLRTNAYSERGKFGSSLVFKSVALLLRKGSGLSVQKEAVHLVYLLLNSPDIFAAFCKSCKAAEEDVQSFDDGARSLTFEECCGILEGLADSVVCPGCGEKELNLRRNAMMVLAFLASSGKSGLEIFLFHKMSERANFLGLILQVLVSEIDADLLDSCTVPEITKTRTLLIREALILLNRLASHPAYSSTVMQVLTSCRDLVSLAIDVATRLSKRSRRLLGCDGITRQMRETEVVDLARVFRRRVFSFLGENISS